MTAPEETVRAWVRAAERADPHEQWAILCFIAGRSVTLDAHERNAALRRSELLLAAGGDPHRPLELYGRAVTALAEDLDDPAARAQLAAGLEALGPAVEGLRGAAEARRLLGRDTDLAWQCYAMAVLAEELAGDE
jgi:hypothetical protein